MASQLIKLTPAVLVILKHDNSVNELEERLMDCAIQAERQINTRFFGGRPPTRNECLETVEVDACGKSVTRAMRLGQQKHALALKCAREVLDALWPAPFSIEQRYRYYPQARILETIGPDEEARLLGQGCGHELWRTIKPDIVLHGSHDLLKSALTLDFKFPCPNTNQAQWTRYGASSAYAGKGQDEIYTAALGGKAVIISPREGVVLR
ncbi:hypothetical protein LXT21_01290 [Myxococcus sp. K38C18041901]|nr:hypothetical protein [Myxococcus guangdongensis]MCP3057405.1 hypothetical protein [Myxococcus guangdongensis]